MYTSKYLTLCSVLDRELGWYHVSFSKYACYVSYLPCFSNASLYSVSYLAWFHFGQDCVTSNGSNRL